VITTERLIMRPWKSEDRIPLARMCADPDVMWDYGRTFTRAETDERFDRYDDACSRFGYGRWAVQHRDDGLFLGYCGIMPILAGHPMEPGVEIGWRFIRAAWGNGYASEAARASLEDGFLRCGMTEVWSFTAANNIRSEAVMRRIGLTRAAARDWIDSDGQRHVVYVGRP
jgi:RimJ/RimL family protein N-acetyltransferase